MDKILISMITALILENKRKFTWTRDNDSRISPIQILREMGYKKAWGFFHDECDDFYIAIDAHSDFVIFSPIDGTVKSKSKIHKRMEA